MENKTLFTERQKFNQWWIRLILLGINALFVFGAYKQIVRGHQFGDKPVSDPVLILVTAIIFLLSLAFMSLRLDTIIKQDGIYVQFFPFHSKFRSYTWDVLSKTYVRQYSAIGEYGGWGLRLGLFGKGTAFNVSGNKGLQLEFKNDKKLLIGTHKAAELTLILKQLEKLKTMT
jgi:hypothetical protein